MSELISEQAVKESGLSFDNALPYAAAAGLVTVGMLAAHNATRIFNKQDSIPVNGIVCLAGLAGAMVIPNKWAKIGLLGIAAFGGLKAIGLGLNKWIGSAPTATPDTAHGIGAISDAFKETLKKFIPTLGTTDYDSVNGTEDQTVNGYAEEVNGFDEVNGFNDAVDESRGTAGTEENLMGVGSVAAQLI